MNKLFLCLLSAMTLCCSAMAEGDNLHTQGWIESAFATWSPITDATNYNVYIKDCETNSWTQLDAPLIRVYTDHLRADALGLKAGDYKFRIIPTNNEVELTAKTVESETFNVAAHDRAGFAHVNIAEGIGAYQNDGTLKEDARVIYVWAGNAKTVTCPVITSSKGTTTLGCGLQDIISLYQKGYDTTPLAIRIIGTLRDSDIDRFDSSSEGLQIKGKNSYSPMPITIEGIGNDATLYGFGILCRNCKGVEVRNLAIMLCMDDCISLDTDNANIWIHHCDFFYGTPGHDADQAKGDGTVDIKGHSRNVTLSYCHFWDCGKSSLGGMKDEDSSSWHTYHHNWFDHSDSRHPRVRTMFFHIYNNYFDGNSKYGIGMTMGGSAFVEANVFRNCRYPMLISGQGTDAEGDGTFSGETGGVIKAFANQITGEHKLQYYDGQQTDGCWDAVLAISRDEEIDAIAYSGHTAYNLEADFAARESYTEEQILPADQVVTCITGPFGAGRMEHGDFKWTFSDDTDDNSSAIDTALKEAIQHYKPSVLQFADGTPINNDHHNQEEPGIDPEPIIGETICHFLNHTPSTSMVHVNGNYSNTKGSISYQGQDYDICVKMESATLISITPNQSCNITLVFGNSDTDKRLKLDGETLHTDAQGCYSFAGLKGTSYQLTKGDSINLFLILFQPTTDSGISIIYDDNDTKMPAYDLMGRRLNQNTNHSLHFNVNRLHQTKTIFD